MYCIVGLGNPGAKYQNTRHNAGFLVIDRIIAQIGGSFKRDFDSEIVKLNYQGRPVLLVKPQTFMNNSGLAVNQVVNYYKIALEQLLIIYDDLDLNPGTIRLRLSGSSGGHRGLTSIMEILNTRQIPRLRLGIGRPDKQITVVDYVLSAFKEEDGELFLQGLRRAAAAALSFVVNGPQITMNLYNKQIESD
ncbi:MAG: aminoacyl-tRNA hydrolase [Bacillota bacterium]